MSPMTPRERVRSAAAHRQPDRVPFSWGFGPTAEMGKILENYLREQGLDWKRLREACDDKIWAGPPGNGKPRPKGAWGLSTRTVSYGGGTYEEFVDFPLAGVDSLAQIHDYPWPDGAEHDFAALPEIIRKANPSGTKAVQLGGGNPFEIYCWMTGIEESLTNMLVQPEIVLAAMDHITTYFEVRLRKSLEAAGDLIDLVFLADDVGTQSGPMMSRQTYRDILQPFHRRLTTCVKQHAPSATNMLHSDGSVFDLLPDLMDAGVEMLEAVQTDAADMDPQRLKDTFGRKLGFHGAISVQQLLPRGDEQTVERECRRLVEVLGEGGGYIAAPAHAIQIGTPPANVMAMLRTVLGAEDFAAACEAARI